MTKDFGEWAVPERWDDITLRQLLDIERERALEKPSLSSIIAILCNRTLNEVEQLPVEFIEKILSKMGFIKEQPEVSASCVVDVDGEVYTVRVKEKLRFGEFCAVETAMKNDPSDIAMLLAIVCRKDGEEYTTDFENTMLEARREFFLGLPCTKVLPLVSFFLNSWVLLNGLSENYSQMKEEVVKSIRRNIESLRSHGGGRRFSTRSQMRKLQKLERYIQSHY